MTPIARRPVAVTARGHHRSTRKAPILSTITRRPRLLDLYCCQGGAGVGYHLAGFDVYGVDIDPQPNYPFPFHQGDVLDVLARLNAGDAIDFTHPDGTVEWLTLADFVARHASPPCQRYSLAQRIQKRVHPDLIGPTREALMASGKPYVIENVEDARPELIDPVTLCGATFGLHTYRHRLFESNVPLDTPAHPRHLASTVKMGRALQPGDWYHAVGNFSGVEYIRGDLGVPWMNRDGIRECIPPVYAEYVGAQLLASLNLAEVAA